MTIQNPSLNLSPVDGQSNGQAPQTPAPQGQGQPNPEGNQQKYVTVEEMRAEIEKVVSNSKSALGKSEARINGKIQELAKAGIQVTPQQAQKAIELEDAAQANGQPQPQGQPTATQQIPSTGDPVADQARAWMTEDGVDYSKPDLQPLVEAYRMMAQAGVRITDEDPETSLIPQKPANALEFLTGIKNAIEAIQARTAAAGSPARVPGLVSGQHNNQPSHVGMSGKQTLEEAYKEFMPK